MIKEEYVSFELAKMLKEKGFKGQGEHFYEDNKITNYINYWPRITPKQRYEAIEAPTLQMAQKWFREEKHLAINPSTFYRMLEGHEFHNWGCNIVNLDTWELYCSDPLETFPADTYEEALEKAMKYALEKFV